MNNIWDNISTPPDRLLSTLKFGNYSDGEILWGKDNLGRCMLLLTVKNDNTFLFKKNKIFVNGLTSDLRYYDELKTQCLVLILDKEVDTDIFYNFCISVIEKLNNPSMTLSAIALVFSQLKRWKEFLSGTRTRMSINEIRGLLGELCFLQEIIVKGNIPLLHAVNCWRGPDKNQHDFILGENAVEIKTLSGSERNTISISSEDQLSTINANLFLKTYLITESLSINEKGISLNGIIKRIYSLLIEYEACALFGDKLFSAGYVYLSDYDEPLFNIIEYKTYKVTDSFPKITRALIPQGIMRVKYEIAVEKITPFLYTESII